MTTSLFKRNSAAFAFSALLLAGCAEPTQAADLGAPAAVSAWEEHPSLWRGAYWNAGFGAGTSGIDVSGAGKTNETDVDQGSVSLFAALGYNFTSGAFVYGLEADISDLGMNKKGAVAGLGNLTSDLGLAGSIRARAGYSIDNVLIYGTAGIAATHLEVSSSLGGKEDLTAIGLVVGLGAEVALDENWRVRGEGLLYGFSENDVKLAGTKHDVDAAHAVFRLGVGRKF